MKEYKGINYLIDDTNTEFLIFFSKDEVLNFKAMYGNKVLYCNPSEARNILLRRIRYLINKHLKKLKGGLKKNGTNNRYKF